MNLREQTRRLNRAGKFGPSRGDHLGDARWHMRVWAEWVATQRERGWPAESIEARMMAYGMVRASMPPGPREPNIDHARLAPKVDRLLRDMDGMGLRRSQEAQALRSHALVGGSTSKAAEALLVDDRTFRRRVRRGLEWLAERLAWLPLERRQAAQGGGTDREAFLHGNSAEP